MPLSRLRKKHRPVASESVREMQLKAGSGHHRRPSITWGSNKATIAHYKDTPVREPSKTMDDLEGMQEIFETERWTPLLGDSGKRRGRGFWAWQKPGPTPSFYPSKPIKSLKNITFPTPLSPVAEEFSTDTSNLDVPFDLECTPHLYESVWIKEEASPAPQQPPPPAKKKYFLFRGKHRSATTTSIPITPAPMPAVPEEDPATWPLLPPFGSTRYSEGLGHDLEQQDEWIGSTWAQGGVSRTLLYAVVEQATAQKAAMEV